jgi:hypothetical protein
MPFFGLSTRLLVGIICLCSLRMTFATQNVTPVGSLLASVTDEFVNRTTWISGVCFPACQNSSCCKDPQAAGKGSGACYKVKACSQLNDKTVALSFRIVRFDLQKDSFESTQSVSIPMHSGPTNFPALGPLGDVYVQLADGPRTMLILTIATTPGSQGSSMPIKQQCVLPSTSKLAAFFYDPELNSLLGVLSSDGISVVVIKTRPVLAEKMACQLVALATLPAPVVRTEPPPVPGLPAERLTNPCKYCIYESLAKANPVSLFSSFVNIASPCRKLFAETFYMTIPRSSALPLLTRYLPPTEAHALLCQRHNWWR